MERAAQVRETPTIEDVTDDAECSEKGGMKRAKPESADGSDDGAEEEPEQKRQRRD